MDGYTPSSPIGKQLELLVDQMAACSAFQAVMDVGSKAAAYEMIHLDAVDVEPSAKHRRYATLFYDEADAATRVSGVGVMLNPNYRYAWLISIPDSRTVNKKARVQKHCDLIDAAFTEYVEKAGTDPNPALLDLAYPLIDGIEKRFFTVNKTDDERSEGTELQFKGVLQFNFGS